MSRVLAIGSREPGSSLGSCFLDWDFLFFLFCLFFESSCRFGLGYILRFSLSRFLGYHHLVFILWLSHCHFLFFLMPCLSLFVPYLPAAFSNFLPISPPPSLYHLRFRCVSAHPPDH
jgi:hypothetical protein